MLHHSPISNNLNDRHVAITDGVFAIAMTILVLEIAVPAVSDITSHAAVNSYIMNYLAPTVLIYFISFYLVYNFWETTTIHFSFKKISNNVLLLNMITLASVCLIPFATGSLFEFYNYTEVNILFSLLILAISILYILMFIMLIRNNFKDYFVRKDEIKATISNELDSYEVGIELDNLKLYLNGVTKTVFYLLMTPAISSIISILLAYISPGLSMASFLLVLVFRFIIRMSRGAKDHLDDIELSDDEKEFVNNVRNNIYGEE